MISSSDRSPTTASGLRSRRGSDSLVANDSNGLVDVFLLERATGTIRLVSLAASDVSANGASDDPSISADGRYVAFTSSATDLAAGDSGPFDDVFVFDRLATSVVRVSTGMGGTAGDQASINPRISADGSTVAFRSFATDLDGR